MFNTGQISTWEAFVRFGPSSFKNHEASLFKLRQTATVETYINEFQLLSTHTPGLSATNLLNCFISGLCDEIQREILLLKPPTLSEAIGMAKLLEEKTNAAKTSRSSFTPTLAQTSMPSRTPLYQQNPPMPQLVSNPTPHPPTLPIKRLTPAQMAARREKGLCYNCDEKFVTGHRCRPPQFLCMLVDTEDNGSSAMPDLCEFSPGEEIATVEIEPQISFHAFTGQFVPKTLKLEGFLGDQPVVVLIDGGSTHNFVQTRLAKHLSLVIQPSPYLNVTVGNGEKIDCGGFCKETHIQLGGSTFLIDFFVLPIYGADIVLGVDWLAQLGPILFDYKDLWLEFDYKGKRLKLKGLQTPSLHQITMNQFRKLAQSDSIVSYFHLTMEAHSTTRDSPIHSKPDSPFSTALTDLLSEFDIVFNKPTQLPPSRSCDHQINLVPSTSPISVRPYRYPHFQKSEIEKLVAEMLADGIIRPSTSPFSSPVLLVKKKDGSWRFCVDYRVLNAATVKDKFPIPTVNELLDELHGATVFSKLDLRSGYHQVRLHTDAIPKTAFRTHEGHYEFTVMPFGLSNAPSTFQALMNDVFRSLLRRCVLVFFDDILVFSPNWETHLTHLRLVLSILQTNSLYAKLSKCEFGCSSIQYLGHIVSGSGVAVDQDKIAAIQAWPIPNSVKLLRGFLGLAGYYRRFVPHFAKLAAPLTALLRKQSFVWTPTANQAFLALKESLMHTPVLALPDFSTPFLIQTDASGTSVGAVLTQHGHPIAYFSKQMCPRLQASSTYEREMFAITEAIKKWRPYLLGRHFTVQTDHQSLRALTSQTIQTTAQQKWITKLLGYDFDIIYRPGTANGPADALSRLPTGTFHALSVLSKPVLTILEGLRHFYKLNKDANTLLTSITHKPSEHVHYTVIDGLIMFKNRIFVPIDSGFQPLLLNEFHSSPIGGHAGIQRTLARVCSQFYWPGMRQSVTNFVNECSICQQVKPFNKAPQGLLQPLKIPGKIWDSISMDFITHLPPSCGKTTIFVVVDRLSKHAHFSALGPHFSVVQVAEIFVKDVVKIHGIPTSIISDRDPLFMSSFWKELFRLQGTTLSTSSAYHPQTDGQTEVLNRCLEDYLRAFVADAPRSWVSFLPWAEYSYNTAFHSAIKMTPFEAVFGRAPPSLQDYLPGDTSVASLDELLQSRQTILTQLHTNLQRAQLRMTNQANLKRSDVQFDVGDWVFLKLQPYRQSSLAHRKSNKLARRFYGPFQIAARVGKVAYRLDLPSEAKIHDVFHVSLLKRCVGDPLPAHSPLPSHFINTQPLMNPENVIGYRTILQNGSSVRQVLVHWEGQSTTDATWEDLRDFVQDFPSFNLEDKVVSHGMGNDPHTNKEHQANGPSVQPMDNTRPKRERKAPSKFSDYV
ncbi:ty3-gypsy retrotransposon protein [Tanacetum coccineum]